MIPDKIRRALLVDIHRVVEKATDSAIRQMKDGSADLVYPPGIELTGEEAEALRNLQLPDAAYSAIKKIMINMAGISLHDLFALIDGVGDPEGWNESGPWLGVSISERGEEHEEMWHDAWFGTYWDYKNKHRL